MLASKQHFNTNLFRFATLGALLLVSGCTNTKALDATAVADKQTQALALMEESMAEQDLPGWHNPMLVYAVQYAAHALIVDLKSAQKSLKSNDLKRTGSYLSAAQDLINGIRAMMPFTVIIDQIKDAEANINLNVDLFETDTLLPIYESLDELEMYAPDLSQQTHDKIGQAEKLAKTGKNIQALEILDQAETYLSSATIYLPVIEVSQNIKNAMTSLKTAPSSNSATLNQVDMAINMMIDSTQNTLPGRLSQLSNN